MIDSISKKWLNPVSLTLVESKGSSKHYKFRATVLVWDPEKNLEWSVKSRNGARYQREASVNAIADSIKRNSGIPFMHNHHIEGELANQLGLVTDYTDTDAGLIIEGKLNANNRVVKEEIVEGFLNNVSLQVDAQREDVDEDGDTVAWARPTDFYEISAVNVPGIPGANLMDIALAESVRNSKTKKQDCTKEEVSKEKIEETSRQKEKTDEEEYDSIEDISDAELAAIYNDVVDDKNDSTEGTIDSYDRQVARGGGTPDEPVHFDEEADNEIVLEESLSEDMTTTTGSGAVGKILHGRDDKSETDLSDDDIMKIYKKIVSAKSDELSPGEEKQPDIPKGTIVTKI